MSVTRQQPKAEWQRRHQVRHEVSAQVDKRASAALADVVFPKKRHALFRELVDMGEDIKVLPPNCKPLQILNSE